MPQLYDYKSLYSECSLTSAQQRPPAPAFGRSTPISVIQTSLALFQIFKYSNCFSVGRRFRATRKRLTCGDLLHRVIPLEFLWSVRNWNCSNRRPFHVNRPKNSHREFSKVSSFDISSHTEALGCFQSQMCFFRISYNCCSE